MALRTLPHIYAEIIEITRSTGGTHHFDLSDGSSFGLPPAAQLAWSKMQKGDFVLIDLGYVGCNKDGDDPCDVTVFRRDDSCRSLHQVWNFEIGITSSHLTFPN